MRRDLLCAILRGEVTRWPDDVLEGAEAEARFLDAACQHGVRPLLARQLRHRGALDGWPTRIRTALESAAVQSAVVEQLLRQEIRLVLASLAAADVRPFLIKGAGLAYTHYPHPCLRPRADTDLLIERGRLPDARRVMEELGYTRFNQTGCDLVMAQSLYVKKDRHGLHHAYDLHWRVANPQLFADVLTLVEAKPLAVKVPALGDDAHALGPVHALLVACVHRVAHHNDSDMLIWLYDIHLLLNNMDGQQLREFVGLAAAKRVKTICARGLALAEQGFGTNLPGDLLAELSAGRTESSEGYLGGRVRRVDILLSDLRSLTGWKTRLRLLREHAFPPAAYMRERYRGRVLPVLYAQRFVRGIGGWFRPLEGR